MILNIDVSADFSPFLCASARSYLNGLSTSPSTIPQILKFTLPETKDSQDTHIRTYEKTYAHALTLNWFDRSAHWVTRETNTFFKCAIIGALALSILGIIPLVVGWVRLKSVDQKINVIQRTVFDWSEEARNDRKNAKFFSSLWGLTGNETSVRGIQADPDGIDATHNFAVCPLGGSVRYIDEFEPIFTGRYKDAYSEFIDENTFRELINAGQFRVFS